MNVDQRLIVRLLLAILLTSLITTILLGKQIHRRIVESMVNKIGQKDSFFEAELSKTAVPARQLLKREISAKNAISPPILTLNQTELDILKTQRHKSFLLPKQEAVREWQDALSCQKENSRTGLGELSHTKENKEHHGFYDQLSNRISLNRSLPDTRPIGCRKRQYLENLPNVTVIMAFHDEQLSVLLRSMTSIINRSPVELLKQIVLVDDDSNLPEFEQQLDDFVAQNFPSIIQIIRLSERRGLINARMEAIKVSSGQVLVFLDSHIEVNANWLPPLLEPIAMNQHIVTGPIMDVISHKTFAYTKQDPLTRSGFNWWLEIERLPLLPEDKSPDSTPYRTPVLSGALAIDRNYFLSLGGFDEQLDTWDAGKIEMSFKVWMCGGMMLYVPCSRVGHISRAAMPSMNSSRKFHFLARNYKRVAEVWMDNYKKYVFDKRPSLYKMTSTGPLSHRKTLRKALKCKTFHWYLTKVAPDFLKRYLALDSPTGFSGVIESVAFPGFCVDSQDRRHTKPVVLARCTGYKSKPGEHQNWSLTQDHEIRLTNSKDDCLEAQGRRSKSVWVFHCHKNGGNQYWLYNRRHRWLQQGQMWVWCLEAHLPSGRKVGKVLANKICNRNQLEQQWKVGQNAPYDPQREPN
ncbi:putative polypeptide N-acetylgalactosaminyltransferase 10 [Drosophila santomea]|uniref:putative polypeptide N-acetylgalactosaminyltransferase 10 n=1 Tax=Drosophila santomea TaxID=129105 RepID=UPI001CC9A8C3|nr:putative polypeptide N-acetylgalactosaminyltransferase 10 [Drosophila santomea]